MLKINNLEEVFNTGQDIDMDIRMNPTRSDLFQVMKQKVWETPEAEEYVLGNVDMLEVANLLNLYSNEDGSYGIQLGTFQTRRRHSVSGVYVVRVEESTDGLVFKFIASGSLEEEVVTDPQIKMELLNRWKEM